MTLVFFLEEPSAEEMLKGILPKIIPDHIFPRFIVFEGKQDLEKQLERRIRLWKLPNSRFIILRDQDAGDCRKIKQTLLEKCRCVQPSELFVRIACHELESFYIGDLAAVEKGLDISGLSKMQNKEKFRDPDRIPNPSQILKSLTKDHYQKVLGSREIGKHLDLNNNRSHSFNVLLKAIERLIIDETGEKTNETP